MHPPWKNTTYRHLINDRSSPAVVIRRVGLNPTDLRHCHRQPTHATIQVRHLFSEVGYLKVALYLTLTRIREGGTKKLPDEKSHDLTILRT